MQISYSPKPHNRVDYFPLPNGHADVFLHRNETTETDEDGNTQYVAEEVYFQIEQSVSKKDIEGNFDYMWQDAERDKVEPTKLDIIQQKLDQQDAVIEEILFDIIPNMLGGLEVNNEMAMYMAEKILQGKQDYTKIFSVSLYKKYQDDVDAILIAEGREDLIER